LLPDAVYAIHELFAWLPAMLNDQNHSGIECPLRVKNVGHSRSLGCNHVFDAYFASIGFKDGMAIGVLAGGSKVSQ
jgi:hypothetical protein